MLMSERWRNGAKAALGAGVYRLHLPRASRCGEHTQALAARTCPHLCRSGGIGQAPAPTGHKQQQHGSSILI